MKTLNVTINADIVIVGTGVAGLFCALNLPRDKKIIMITKEDTESSDSYLAQGGMCVLKNEDDYDSYFEDTLRAGHYENNRDSVDIMIRSSREIAQDLIGYGVAFTRDLDGNLTFTREGAHSSPRILFHKDITGKEIVTKLLSQVRKLDNVSIVEYTTMLDIIEQDNTCYGIVCKDSNDGLFAIAAKYTVWACGGIGGLYTNSTNFRHLTGDALAISLKHNIRLQNIDYIQIHPTTLYSHTPGRRFLISESVRGEGAILLNADGKRFVNELLPRDVVSAEIFKQMEKDKAPNVWLSMAPIKDSVIKAHFPNIVKRCLEEGYDVTRECIPVVPAQHYFMGGVYVDRYSKTSMNQLYAAGETSCNGVHGANRLASNSLLESLVFAKRAAKQMTQKFDSAKNSSVLAQSIDLTQYVDYSMLQEHNKALVLKEIRRIATLNNKTLAAAAIAGQSKQKRGIHE